MAFSGIPHFLCLPAGLRRARRFVVIGGPALLWHPTPTCVSSYGGKPFPGSVKPCGRQPARGRKHEEPGAVGTDPATRTRDGTRPAL